VLFLAGLAMAIQPLAKVAQALGLFGRTVREGEWVEAVCMVVRGVVAYT
tara:strand:- start:8854 stop:9000 length:147 start_codon:yes stop_codon:yes gene_type:complete